jgi:hypothetical protein
VIGALLDPPRRTFVALASLLGVAAVVVLALLADRPPSPAPASAPAQQFSAQRALVQLREFATEPRPLGSPASDRTRDHLARALRTAGFSVKIERAVGASTEQGFVNFGRVDNIVATLPGRDPTGNVVLAAHYDSVAAGPGASDDGAAVASMLETVRALRSDGSPGDGGRQRNNLVLLITDGEEDGLLGAAGYVRQHPQDRRPTVVLNWEARGVSGPSLMFETSRDNAALVELFAAAAPHPRGDSSMVELYRMLPNNTDFTEFAGSGMTGMNFAYIEGAARYHTPGDSIANLDRASLQNHGANMLGLTRALGDTDLRTLVSDHDATYFSLFDWVVVYPADLVWPVALLAAIVLAGLVVLARCRRLLSIPRLLLGVVCALLPLATAALLAQGLWPVLLTLRPDHAENPYLYRPQLYQLAVAVLAGFAVLGWYLLLRRRVGPAALAGGALVWLTALGLLVAWAAPGASHLFALPALGWSLGALIALLLHRAGSVAPALAMTLGVVPAALFVVPLAVGAFAATGLVDGGVPAVLLALFLLTLLPILELSLPALGRPLGWRRAVAVPVTAVVLVLALTGAGLAVDRIDPAHPRRADLAYLLDADTGRAEWVSRGGEPAPWARQYVARRADGSERAVDLAEEPVWLGPAPVLRAPGPELTLRARRGDTVDLHIRSPRSASTVLFRVDRRVDELTVTAPGLAPARIQVAGTRAGPWPTQVRFGDLPAEGIDVTMRVRHQGPLRISAYDLTDGLGGIPGFSPRPPGLERPQRPDSDAVIVARNYEF